MIESKLGVLDLLDEECRVGCFFFFIMNSSLVLTCMFMVNRRCQADQMNHGWASWSKSVPNTSTLTDHDMAQFVSIFQWLFRFSIVTLFVLPNSFLSETFLWHRSVRIDWLPREKSRYRIQGIGKCVARIANQSLSEANAWGRHRCYSRCPIEHIARWTGGGQRFENPGKLFILTSFFFVWFCWFVNCVVC